MQRNRIYTEYEHLHTHSYRTPKAFPAWKLPESIGSFKNDNFSLQIYVQDTIIAITGLVGSVFNLFSVRRLDTYCILLDKYILYHETVTGRYSWYVSCVNAGNYKTIKRRIVAGFAALTWNTINWFSLWGWIQCFGMKRDGLLKDTIWNHTFFSCCCLKTIILKFLLVMLVAQKRHDSAIRR